MESKKQTGEPGQANGGTGRTLLFWILLFLINCIPAESQATTDNFPTKYRCANSKTLTKAWEIDFSALHLPLRHYLATCGFIFKQAFIEGGTIGLSLNKNQLRLDTHEPSFGIAIAADLSPFSASCIEIDWGVDRYPNGANWQTGMNREAIMIYLFFGDPVPADRFYLPDLPYFIGLFLGRNEQPQQVFSGSSYRETGRYVCLGRPAPGQLITSRFDVDESFRRLFETAHIPAITGIAVEMDTADLPDGAAIAFLHRITLLQDFERE